MATRTVKIVVDDFDDSQDAREVRFAFDGEHYAIDLTEENREALREALEPYMRAGRRVRDARRSSASNGRAGTKTGTKTGPKAGKKSGKKSGPKSTAKTGSKTGPKSGAKSGAKSGSDRTSDGRGPEERAASNGAPAAGEQPAGEAWSFPDVDSKVVREWAVAQGLEVPARGRVPIAVLREYHAAEH